MLCQVGELEMRWRGSGVLCQVGELEMIWRGREWCVMSGGSA